MILPFKIRLENVYEYKNTTNVLSIWLYVYTLFKHSQNCSQLKIRTFHFFPYQMKPSVCDVGDS